MPETTPSVVSVNISAGGIPKRPVEVAEVTFEGLAGDGHDHDKHDGAHMAISLLDVEDYDDLKREGFDVFPGATGDNVTVRDLSIDDLAIGDQLRFAGGVVLELTKRRKPCFVLDAIDPDLKTVIVGRIGYIAKVVTTGELRPGEAIEVIASTATVES